MKSDAGYSVTEIVSTDLTDVTLVSDDTYPSNDDDDDFAKSLHGANSATRRAGEELFSRAQLLQPPVEPSPLHPSPPSSPAPGASSTTPPPLSLEPRNLS